VIDREQASSHLRVPVYASMIVAEWKNLPLYAPSRARLLLPDAASSDRERLLNKTLAEPCIELRKLLQISRTSCRSEDKCRVKSVDCRPKFSAQDQTYAQDSGMASSERYNAAVTET
jgi:hypothetical protein